MYGAGSIGRGFLGQLFGMSDYRTCFVDVDAELVSRLKDDGEYVISVASENGYENQVITNCTAVNGLDSPAVASEISNCDIMATAVGVNILPRIAKTIARGLDERFEAGGLPLDIIVCENISDSGNYLKNLVSSHIVHKEYFEKSVGFVSASVGRMVPTGTGSHSSEIVVESYNQLPVDADALKTDVSDIMNFVPVTPFAIEKYKKYFMHNMSHAICAYMGFIKGYEYLWQAVGDDAIRSVASKALDESIAAISKYFDVDSGPLRRYADDLLYRYSNKYLKDTVARVGRDPKRKLQPNDRLAGAAHFCLKRGVVPEFILYGIAAAFCFDIEGDVSSSEVQGYVSEYGIEAAIIKFTGITPQSSMYVKTLKIYSIFKKQL